MHKNLIYDHLQPGISNCLLGGNKVASHVERANIRQKATTLCQDSMSEYGLSALMERFFIGNLLILDGQYTHCYCFQTHETFQNIFAAMYTWSVCRQRVGS